MKVSFTHPHVVPNLYDFVSYNIEHNGLEHNVGKQMMTEFSF